MYPRGQVDDNEAVTQMGIVGLGNAWKKLEIWRLIASPRWRQVQGTRFWI